MFYISDRHQVLYTESRGMRFVMSVPHGKGSRVGKWGGGEGAMAVRVQHVATVIK